MDRPLERTQKHLDWEESNESVSKAVKTLQDATQKIEQRPNAIITIGRDILRTFSNQARKAEEATQAGLSAALMTIETFLRQASPAAPQQQLFELVEDASQTLARYLQASKQGEAPAANLKQRFAKFLSSKQSNQQDVSARIAQIRPQTQLKPDPNLLFYIRTLATCHATTHEIDAFHLKAAAHYRARYQNCTSLESLSIVRNAPIRSFTVEVSPEEAKNEPGLKKVRLQTILTNPALGERVPFSGEFLRAAKGASRSVPITTSFIPYPPELHTEFPLCVQSNSFAWALPEKFFSEKNQIKQAERHLDQTQLLAQNAAILEMKNHLFRSCRTEYLPLVERLISSIVQRINNPDSSWKTIVRDFFAHLSERQDPFIFLSLVHQRLQTLLIVRPMQLIEEEKQKAFSLHDAQCEDERSKNLLKRIFEKNFAELESLKQNLDPKTHAYLYTLSKLLLPHTKSLLLNLHYHSRDFQLSDWQQALRVHALKQSQDFAEQLQLEALPSEEMLKEKLSHQIHGLIGLWKEGDNPSNL